MSTQAPKFEAKAQPDGRIAYTVHGVLTTYDMQEAIDLMSTGVFRIACPMTREVAEKGPRDLTCTVVKRDPTSKMPYVVIENYRAY